MIISLLWSWPKWQEKIFCLLWKLKIMEFFEYITCTVLQYKNSPRIQRHLTTERHCTLSRFAQPIVNVVIFFCGPRFSGQSRMLETMQMIHYSPFYNYFTSELSSRGSTFGSRFHDTGYEMIESGL